MVRRIRHLLDAQSERDRRSLAASAFTRCAWWSSMRPRQRHCRQIQTVRRGVGSLAVQVLDQFADGSSYFLSLSPSVADALARTAMTHSSGSASIHAFTSIEE